ncbi:type IV pilin protein [Chitiniphilus purpureus]|uniref:Type IV pilin protein n=2 Tax=Chitiniphilus purpureus TaxID=2981137 RepID=A0ABY6DSC0_9NEIS|nr:type IV pilin protein [Chitiniphilus sp. CD1]
MPSYQEYVYKTRRGDVQGVLLQNAQLLERRYTTNNAYFTGAGACPAAPISQSPVDGATKYYNITVTQCTAEAYVLRASPIGVQQRYGANKDFLELTSAGVRSWDKNHDGAIGSGESSWK